MATKTVILRPVSCTVNSSGASSYFPIETSDEQAYMLVNESVADDDSTYICNLTQTDIIFNFDASPLNRVTIPEFTLHFFIRLKGSVANSLPVWGLNGPTSGGEDFEQISTSLEANTWGTWEGVATAVKNYVDEWQLNIRLPAPTSKVNNEYYITQLYFLAEYEAPIVNVKENGQWTFLPSLIYRKTSGTWERCTAAELEEEKYVIKDLTS